MRPTASAARRRRSGGLALGAAALASRSFASLCFALLFVTLCSGCSGLGNPGAVADKFVDKYYVESDQTGALPLAAGVAELRLHEELRLTAEARRPGAEMPSRQVRVYYQRTALSGAGPERIADYTLDIRPQGGGQLQREAHLTLAQGPDGTWRVTRFAESGATR